MGYALGDHRLEVDTTVISVVALVFLLVVAQGYAPGIEPADPGSRNA